MKRPFLLLIQVFSDRRALRMGIGFALFLLWVMFLAVMPMSPAQAQGNITATPVPGMPTPVEPATPRPPFPVSFTPTPQPAKTDTYVFTVDQLGNGGDLILHGILPSASIYPAISEDWDIADGSVEIRFTHSALLANDSSLTIKVNGTPVGSVWLTPENVSETKWVVQIPRGLLTGDYPSITFSGYLKINKDICQDPENEGNWATVKGSSVVRFNVRTLPFQPNLGRFPYPFFRARIVVNPSPLFIVPNAAPAEDWAAYLPLATFLGQKADWRKFGVYAVREQDLTDGLRHNYDLILAGRADQFNLIKSNPAQFSLRLAPDGKLLDQAGNPMPDDSGMVLEVVSPWNPGRGLLLLTGNTPEGIRRVAQAVIQPSFPSVARGSSVIVTEPPKPEPLPGKTNFDSVSLGALGFKDLTSSGLGQHTVDVNFELPAGQNVSSAKVTVYFSHAPFVSNDRSFLNVVLNDAPIKGVYLSKDNEDFATFAVDLPPNSLRAGRNTLRFFSQLHLNRSEDCTEQGLNEAWLTIFRDTTLNLTFGQTPHLLGLSDYPVPFNEGGILVLPSDPGPNELSGAFLLMSELGRELGTGAGAIEVVPANGLNQDTLKSKHVILLGRPENNAVLLKATASFPYRIDGSMNRLSGPKSALSVQGTEPIGLLQYFVSPWDSSRLALAITGTNDEAVGWASLVLSNPGQRAALAGNVAVIDSKGTLTTQDTRLPPPPPEGKLRNTTPTPEWVLPVLVGALTLLIIVLVVLILRRLKAMVVRGDAS